MSFENNFQGNNQPLSTSRYILCHQTPVNDASLQNYESQSYGDYSTSVTPSVEGNGSSLTSSQGLADPGYVIEELAPYQKQPRVEVRPQNPSRTDIQCQETAVFSWDQGPYTNPVPSSSAQNSQPHPDSSIVNRNLLIPQSQNDVVRHEGRAEVECSASRVEQDASNSSSFQNQTQGTIYFHFTW